MINKEGKDQPNILKWALIRFAISVAAAVITVGVFAAVTKDEAKEGKQEASKAAVTNEELIEAIVESCEENGNPLRKVVQSMLRENIAQTRNKALYEEFFPDADPAKLDHLIEAQVKRTRKRLAKINPLNCQNQHPDRERNHG